MTNESNLFAKWQGSKSKEPRDERQRHNAIRAFVFPLCLRSARTSTARGSCCRATMDDSDDEVQFVEVRKPPPSSVVAAAAVAAVAAASSHQRDRNHRKRSSKNKSNAGPPPRLAWGATGVSAVGHGRSSGGNGSLEGIGSGGSGSTSAYRRSAGPSKKRLGLMDDSDDDLWADDDDLFNSASSSSSRAASSARIDAAINRKAKRTKQSSATSSKSNAKPRSSSASLAAANTTNASSSSSSMLWVDKYAPTDASGLCVAPKKVKEVREWMVQSTSSPPSDDSEQQQLLQQQQLSFGMPPQQEAIVPRLLVLVGSPGTGKSTAIRVLSSELGWTVHQWNDAQQDTTSHFAGSSSIGYGGYGGDRDLALSVRWQNQLSSFEDFLASAGTGFSPLHWQNDHDDGGLGQLAAVPSRKSKKKTKKRKSPTTSAVIGGAASANDSEGKGGTIILIEDIPNLYSPEAEMTFRNIMSRHIYHSQTPTVLIFSDVCEGKHRPSDLERLVDPSVLYSPLARICQINAVAKPKMKKCLQIIVKAERLRMVSDSLFEELHSSSKGDMRHAIMALQFQYASAGGSSKGSGTQDEYGDRDRDTKLSTFHALGKLLYAKRKKLSASESEDHAVESAKWNSIMPAHMYDSRPPLQFVPEDVMNKSDIEHSGAVSFLAYHCPEYFTSEFELTTAFDHFSDAALFLDRTYSSSRDRSDAIFPLEYVASIAGRAVANANKNPAPSRFRQLNAPKVFEVMKKKRGNDVSMLQLCKRLSCGSDVLSLEANIGSSNHFVVDTLPYMRAIVPSEVDSALSNLYSYARPRNNGGANIQPDSASILRKNIQEQEELLADDDIADDDSVDEPMESEVATGATEINTTNRSSARDRDDENGRINIAAYPEQDELPKAVKFADDSSSSSAPVRETFDV